MSHTLRKIVSQLSKLADTDIQALRDSAVRAYQRANAARAAYLFSDPENADKHATLRRHADKAEAEAKAALAAYERSTKTAKVVQAAPDLSVAESMVYRLLKKWGGVLKIDWTHQGGGERTTATFSMDLTPEYAKELGAGKDHGFAIHLILEDNQLTVAATNYANDTIWAETRDISSGQVVDSEGTASGPVYKLGSHVMNTAVKALR